MSIITKLIIFLLIINSQFNINIHLLITFNHAWLGKKEVREKMMTINSTVISGSLKNIEYLIKEGQNILIVSDKNIMQLAPALDFISLVKTKSQILTIIDDVPPEPANHDVTNIINRIEDRIDCVIGIGGGSVLDIAKLLAVLCAKETGINLASLLEGEKPTQRVSSILIPTTAGTGSEATPNSILGIPEKETKIGIISPVMLPDYVVLAPELTTSLPQQITASTGIDALCHLLECYTANKANPVSDNLALIGMKKLFESLPKVQQNPADLEARLNMLWASYYGGACIFHSGTHLVHAMSYPLGGKFHVPHGLANSLLLVPCMKMIRATCVAKFATIYDLIPNANQNLCAEDKSFKLINEIELLIKLLHLPTQLNQIDIGIQHLPELAKTAMDVKRLIANSPVEVNEQDILNTYLSIQ